MMSYFSPVLAEGGQSLLDNQWLALFVILGSITAFLHAIIAFRRSLSAPQKPEFAQPVSPIASAPPAAPAIRTTTATPPPAPSSEPSTEVFAAIAAAVAVTFGSKARIAAINSAPQVPATESSRLQWSMEGRRQIYSSHKVR